MILNLGCGRLQKKDCVNVDAFPYPGIDQIVDLSKYPWPWADGSISGIHASHVIEHLPDQEKFIWECLRILKKGGFLRLNVPHSSGVLANGCMGHYRTYSYNTLEGYLARDFYMFGDAKFKTVEQKLLWWGEVFDPYNEVPKWMSVIIKCVAPVFDFLIRLSPEVFENVWCYWIGGAREVVWKGEKL